MPKPLTLSKPALLLALSAALLLTACGTERPRLALPPVDRAAPVTVPPVPAGEAVCAGAPCLSDREVGGLLASYANALAEANRKLAWLHDWIGTAGK